MSKLKIAIDIDNILNNLMEKTIEAYNAKYGSNLDMDNFTDYDIYNCLPYNEAKKFVELFLDKDLIISLTPKDGAQKSIKQLINKGYDIYLATSTHYTTFPWKVEWIKRYFNDISDKNIICINDKSLLKVDILIDDCVDNLLSSIYFERICLDFPWNRQVHDEAYDIYRCHSWNEIVKAIDDINKHNKN